LAAFKATFAIPVHADIKYDDLVKSQNSMAKEKAPNSRRANPEE